METKCSKSLVDPLFRSFGYSFSYSIDAVDTRGGLWMGFKVQLVFDVVHVCQNFILVKVNECNGRLWYLCLFYDEPSTAKRVDVWEYAYQWLYNLEAPFLIMGDFNQVEYTWDKQSNSTNRIDGLDIFCDWKSSLRLMDISFKGPKFTWCNNREGDHIVFERLDKAYGSSDWRSIYPDSGIIHYPIQISDYAPIVFDSNPVENKERKPYKMDAWNLEHSECMEWMLGIWNIVSVWRLYARNGILNL
ncbi:uncharacterized protein LOC141590287 [Silene latifolia]|uniref:uncharacterized protein LOC141590287 n=1 Tax=Silene latifolia TaxID=37657 RepID=UPI003D7760AF